MNSSHTFQNIWWLTVGLHNKYTLTMDHVRQNKIQGRNMVFFKAHAYSISFCLTQSIDCCHFRRFCTPTQWIQILSEKATILNFMVHRLLSFSQLLDDNNINIMGSIYFWRTILTTGKAISVVKLRIYFVVIHEIWKNTVCCCFINCCEWHQINIWF